MNAKSLVYDGREGPEREWRGATESLALGLASNRSMAKQKTMTSNTANDRRSPRPSMVSLLGRAAIVVLVLWGAWTLLTPPGSDAPQTRPESAESDRVETAVFNASPAFLLGDLLNGDWRFAGASWRVKLSAFDADRFAQPPEHRRASRVKNAMDDEILSLFAAFKATRESVGEFEKLQFRVSEYEATAYTTNEPGVGALVEAVQLIYGQPDQRSLLSVEPAGASELTSQTKLPDAPPLESLGSVLATRWTGDDVCVGVIANRQASEDAIANAWTDAGWNLDANALKRPGQPTLCRRGSSLWAVTFFTSATGEPLILLVRAPEDQ